MFRWKFRIYVSFKIFIIFFQIGNTVTVYDVEFDEEVEYTIVGSTEVNLAENKISNESPIGKALLGAKKGAKVQVNAPAGIIEYEIRKITK